MTYIDFFIHTDWRKEKIKQTIRRMSLNWQTNLWIWSI